MGADCIDIFNHPSQPGTSFGIFHQVDDPNMKTFSLYLAQSADGLTNWSTVAKLQNEASQGKVWVNPKGEDVLVVYETTNEELGNNIVLNHYQDISSLLKAKPIKRVSLARSLAPISEGTPSFERVDFSGGDLATAVILLNFHYHKDSLVDQQAVGLYGHTAAKKTQHPFSWQFFN